MIQKNRVLILDFDSTLISIESLDLLAEICLQNKINSASIITNIKNLTSLGMKGKITFQDSLRKRLRYLQIEDYHFSQLNKKLRNFISPSIIKNQSWLKKNRDNIYIFSGGFKRVIDPIALSLGLKKNQVFGNEFLYDNNDSITGLDFQNPLSQSKGKFLLAKKLGMKKNIIMIGDGSTDAQIKQLGKSAVFIAYTEHVYRKSVVDIADYNAKTFDDVIDYVSNMK